MRRAILLAALLPVAACDAPPQNVIRMQNLGHYRLLVDPRYPDRIGVQMLNVRDLGAPNIDTRTTRHAEAQKMVQLQCGNPSVLSDDYTRTGGVEASQLRVYTITMHCPAGATTPAR